MARAKPELKRILGVDTVTLFTIGTILGAGTYALIGMVGELTARNGFRKTKFNV